MNKHISHRIFRSVALYAVASFISQAVAQEPDTSLTAASIDKDHIAQLQMEARTSEHALWGHWGRRLSKYSSWTSHSNRLIPVYTFNCDFDKYSGANSAYRSTQALEKMYGRVPEHTLNPDAEYGDQTDIYRLQRDLVDQGKRRVILIVFDGTDWHTTWAAATYKAGRVAYREGRGTGLSFQDYTGVSTSFSFVVTSPAEAGEKVDVDAQRYARTANSAYGGYCSILGGSTPWDSPSDFAYLISGSRLCPHAVTDSASSATSLMAGIKTYNAAINVDITGAPVEPIAHWVQRELKWSVGAITSVPISHATPACAYAQNVSRDDYQDLTRDLLGLPSVMNKDAPLSGLDVLIGCGWGVDLEVDVNQGHNFLPGNRYLTNVDFEAAVNHPEHPYVAALRTPGLAGGHVLQEAKAMAIREGKRLLGYFGTSEMHLPFQTADGDFQPMPDVEAAEQYTAADLMENPSLAEMAVTGLDVLNQNPHGMWAMIEAGDVDWANHNNNIDNSIGAVLAGEKMVAAVFDWIEQHGGWADTAVIVTADHGHYLHLIHPETLIPPRQE